MCMKAFLIRHCFFATWLAILHILVVNYTHAAELSWTPQKRTAAELAEKLQPLLPAGVAVSYSGNTLVFSSNSNNLGAAKRLAEQLDTPVKHYWVTLRVGKETILSTQRTSKPVVLAVREGEQALYTLEQRLPLIFAEGSDNSLFGRVNRGSFAATPEPVLTEQLEVRAEPLANDRVQVTVSTVLNDYSSATRNSETSNSDATRLNLSTTLQVTIGQWQPFAIFDPAPSGSISTKTENTVFIQVLEQK